MKKRAGMFMHPGSFSLFRFEPASSVGQQANSVAIVEPLPRNIRRIARQQRFKAYQLVV
ncbi:hypothetical protein [Paenibacillus solanacearum]|uniref:hypothetical protein n=1 Tax=Paenibacillus solanacearum TaxID=2048548 RepID=UPI001C4048EF|nr:hypothetical protein [Paenibacillus solanacearum]